MCMVHSDGTQESWPQQGTRVFGNAKEKQRTCLSSSCFWHSSLATWSRCCSRAARNSSTSLAAASLNVVCIFRSCALYLRAMTADQRSQDEE